MSEQTSPPPPGGLAVVRGGVDLEVEYQDGHRETVKVRKLPLDDMERYLGCLKKASSSIELFCERPAGWSAQLTEESQMALFKKGTELNLPLLEGWYPEFLRILDAVRPGLVQAVAQGANGKSASSNTAPISRSALGSP